MKFTTDYAAQVTLSRAAQDALRKDAYQRQHIEACGLLLGQIDAQGNWHVEQILPLRNIYESPVYFEFAPEDLLAAELLYPERIIGVYHSHPTGFAKASSTDRENMRRINSEQDIPWVWLILRGPFRKSADTLTDTELIAYHHYRQEGLRQIKIVLHATQEPGDDSKHPPEESSAQQTQNS